MEGTVTKYKIVFIGDQAVGKTAILQRVLYNDFKTHSQPTVGIDFITKTISIQERTIKLQLWDTAGQERFRALIPSYVRDCKAVVCVFDLTKTDSLANLAKWIEFAKEQRGDDLMLFLVGNKLDLSEEVVEPSQEVLDSLCQLHKYTQLFKVSAKTGENINSVFSAITQTLLEKDEQTARQDDSLPPQNYITTSIINNKGHKLGKANNGYENMNSKGCKC